MFILAESAGDEVAKRLTLLQKGIMGNSKEGGIATTGTIKSKDGSTIGYRQMGAGPAVILVHGGMMASQNFVELGKFLSKDFTVYIPDRRGRGMSKGATEFGLEKESEDIQALAQAKGARNIFGLSSGAIVVMQAALMEPSLKKVAIYEPPLPFDARPLAWVPRYEQAMQQGNYGAAMAVVLKGTGDRGLFSWIPFFVLRSVFNLAIKKDSNASAEKVDIKTLIGMMREDIQIVRDSKSILERYKELKGDVLLMGGTKSRDFLTANLDRISVGLPNAKRVVFKGHGHIAADNRGKPEWVARELKMFFEG